MFRKILVACAALASTSLAVAEDTHTKTPVVGGGTAEETTDTSHNPLTGNDTTTTKKVVKDAKGNTVSERKAKMKVHHKSGKLMKKEVDEKKMDAKGNTTSDMHSEETHSD